MTSGQTEDVGGELTGVTEAQGGDGNGGYRERVPG